MIRYQQKFVLNTMVACTMSLLRMKYSFTCGFFSELAYLKILK